MYICMYICIYVYRWMDKKYVFEVIEWVYNMLWNWGVCFVGVGSLGFERRDGGMESEG